MTTSGTTNNENDLNAKQQSGAAPQGKRSSTGLIVGATISLVGLSIAYGLLSLCGPQTFSSEKWKSEPCCRQRMLQSLEMKHPLTGMTKAQVVELLGKADKESETTWQYTFSGQDKGLDVTWGADGKVAAAAK